MATNDEEERFSFSYILHLFLRCHFFLDFAVSFKRIFSRLPLQQRTASRPQSNGYVFSCSICPTSASFLDNPVAICSSCWLPFLVSPTEYDGFGGGGGGGFMSGSQGGGEGKMGSPDASSAKRNNDTSLVPITIKQLQNAEVSKDGKCVIDHKEVNMVKLVALVLSVEATATYIGFTIDDGTGQLGIRYYTDPNDEDHAKIAGVHEHTYARFVGNARVANQSKFVYALQINPVTDHNEITFHSLEVLASHLRRTRTKGQGGESGSGGGNYVVGGAGGGMKQDPYAGLGGGAAGGGGGGAHHDLKSRVIAIIRANQTEVGASTQDLMEGLGGHVPLEQVREALALLEQEGVFYHTVDDDHFKSVD